MQTNILEIASFTWAWFKCVNCLQRSSIPQSLPLACFIIGLKEATAIWRAGAAKSYVHQQLTIQSV